MACVAGGKCCFTEDKAHVSLHPIRGGSLGGGTSSRGGVFGGGTSGDPANECCRQWMSRRVKRGISPSRGGARKINCAVSAPVACRYVTDSGERTSGSRLRTIGRPPVRPSARPSVHPAPASLSVCPSVLPIVVCPFARLPVCPYARMPVCPSARMSVCQYARMPVCPYARLPVCPYARMLVRLLVCPSVRFLPARRSARFPPHSSVHRLLFSC